MKSVFNIEPCLTSVGLAESPVHLTVPILVTPGQTALITVAEVAALHVDGDQVYRTGYCSTEPVITVQNQLL